MLTCELVILNTHFAVNRRNRLISRLERNWLWSGFVFWGDMSSVLLRPLVEALAKRCGQAASCHARLRCHAWSSDWVTVQREKVTVSRQRGCHSCSPRLQRYKQSHTCNSDTHTETHTHLIPQGNLRSLESCVPVVSFGGVLYLCHVRSEWSYCWVSNCNILGKLT